MNRIDNVLNKLQSQGKKMLSPYITAGDPTPQHTVDLMHALVEAGADILEIGIPFSDPMAEGPVIQAAMERALTHHMTCKKVFELIENFRQKNTYTPIVLMGYTNSIENYGYEKFAKQARVSGVDGTILVDLPPEESHELAAIWKKNELYPIYLCSPTTTDERMKLINQYAQGYLYFVSLKGVTGSNEFELEKVKHVYEQRKAQTKLPLMVGFGIKTAPMAAKVTQFADGAIVGAALISTIIDAFNKGNDAVNAGASLIKEMRQAINQE